MLDGLSEQEWQDILAYWVARPRGEYREDLRALLAQLIPSGKKGVQLYLDTLGLNGSGASDESVEGYVRETQGMSPLEKVQWIAENTAPITSELTPEEQERFKQWQAENAGKDSEI